MTGRHEKPYEAFRAAGWTDDQLLTHGYMSHDPQATRRTMLGDLPIGVNTIDMLDRRLSTEIDRNHALQERLHEAYAELSGLRRLRKALKRGALDELASRLHGLSCLIDPEILERD